jgi:hypothetical protein
MKRLILASILCLPLFAQEKPQIELIPPEKLLEIPKLVPPAVVKNTQTGTVVLTLKGTPPQVGICSVPLLEAHVDAADPGIAYKPGNTTVPIPQARVPAPPCPRK